MVPRDDPRHSRKSVWRELGRCRPYLRPYSRPIAAVVIITILSSGLPALEPLGFRAIFDRIGGVPAGAARALLGPVAFLFGLWLVRYGFDLVTARLAWRGRPPGPHDPLAQAPARLPTLPPASHPSPGAGATITPPPPPVPLPSPRGRGGGETMPRLDRGVGSLMEGLAQLTFQAVPAAIYVTVSALIMFHLSPILMVLAVGFVLPPTLLGRRRTSRLVD